MPHTRLKVCSVLLIIYGACDILGVLVTAVVAFAIELLVVIGVGVPDLLSALPDWMVPITFLILILALVYLLWTLLFAGLAVVNLMAGINGIRFCSGSCNIKSCRIPAIIVIVLTVINCIWRLLWFDTTGVAGSEIQFMIAAVPVVHIVITVLYIVFAEQVEQYNIKYSDTIYNNSGL